MNKETIGWIDIIFKMYKQSHPHGSEIVKDASSRTEVRERLLDYFNRLEEVHKRVSESKSKTGENMLKNFYYDLYVIKPENIPEAYFQNQVRIARERGMGNITLTEEDRKRYADAAIEDQKLTLDKWIEYFLYDDESKSYEMWEKYWVFQGLQSLGKYDKETKKFAKRDDTTVYPFPPVEKEYIFTTIHLMEEYIKSKTGDEEIKAALGNANFKQIYEYVIKQSMLKGECKSKTIEGKWVKYEQGSDYHVLRDSLQGYYTGWCTAAGESFARGQLANGDFYVYYSLDENGDAKVPRIAIRMDGKNKIGEIRGIADGQNMESEMMPILNKKLDEFPDKDNYLKRVHDMDLLTLIDKKTSHGKELSLDEIRFLYEVDREIIGFGYKKDPRINEIKQKRNKVKDYNLVFKYNKEFNGDLDLSGLTSAEGLDLSGVNIGGALYLNNLTSAEGLDLSGVNIGGALYLNNLTSAEGLKLPESIGGNLYLWHLMNAKGLELPKSIGGDLNLSGLTSAEGLDLSGVNIGGVLDLSGLTSAEGLDLTGANIGGLNLSGLTSAEGLDLSGVNIGGALYLNNLTSAEGLKLPESIGGNLYLWHLMNAKGLELPKSIGGDLNLSGLTSAEGLDLSGVNIGGVLDLSGLTSAEGLDLTGVNIGGLNLSGLTSAEGLDLSGANIGGLDLSGLTSAEGLDLTGANIGGLDLSGLTSAEGLDLSGAHIDGAVDLRGLTSAEGLDLSGVNIGGALDLSGLTSAEGLDLTGANIGGLNLSGLTSAEGLDLSGVNIGSALDLSGLTSAKDLDLSGAHIGSALDLSGLTSAEGLDLSGAHIYGGVDLNSLTSAKDLDLSGAHIGSALVLSGLTSAEGLDLSGVNIGGGLNLSGLTSVEGLDLSGANIGGLDLSGLTSAKDLDLSGAHIGWNLYLCGLTSAEGLDLSGVNIGGALFLNNLTSAEGLDLSGAHIHGLDLRSLTSAEGLMLPYDFELNNLFCNDDIKEEIRNNHDKYFAKPPVEEEFNEAVAQKFNDETETLIINGNGDKKVAYVKKYDGTVEKIPYSKNMDKFIGEQKSAMERGESSRFFEISSDPEVAKGQVEALEEIINRNNNLDSADNSKQSDENVVDESMNVHRTR